MRSVIRQCRSLVWYFGVMEVHSHEQCLLHLAASCQPVASCKPNPLIHCRLMALRCSQTLNLLCRREAQGTVVRIFSLMLGLMWAIWNFWFHLRQFLIFQYVLVRTSQFWSAAGNFRKSLYPGLDYLDWQEFDSWQSLYARWLPLSESHFGIKWHRTWTISNSWSDTRSQSSPMSLSVSTSLSIDVPIAHWLQAFQ